MLTDDSRQSDFPALEGMSYLNTAAEGIPPRSVIAALAQYGQDKLLGMDGRQLHEAQRADAKKRLARAYGMTPDEVSFCSCSSEAYNLVALALQLSDEDEVIINDLDFPAGATPWLQPSCPANVKLWRMREGALHVEDLVRLLSSRTRLLTVSLVSFFNGYRIPLTEVINAVRKNSDALLALDVTQALGRIPLELGGVDLVVSSTHKWILASHGGGLVGVPSPLAEKLTVPAGGWFHLENAFEPDRFERVVTRPGAASFSVGMPNYPAIYAINAGLEYSETIGVEAVDAHCWPLMRYCFDELEQLPIELLTPDEPAHLAGIIGLRHPDAERIHRALHQENIHIMHHAGRLRIAIHGYNTMADLESLFRVLHDQLK